MIRSISPFWAKKQDRNGKYEWISLVQHLKDSGSVARLLWTHWLSEGQRRCIIDSLSIPSDNIAVRLVGFLGAIHDIGKATPVFQAKTGFANSFDLDSLLIERLEGAGFLDLRVTRFANPEKTPHALAGHYLLTTHGVGKDIASIVGSHHGKPVDFEQVVQEQISYDRNYYQIENRNHVIYQKWKNEQKQIIDWALKISEFENIDELPSVQQNGQVLLSGLVIMADWIASNQKYFPLTPLEISMVDDPETRIKDGFTKWFEDASYPWEAEPNVSNKHYYLRFGFEPHNIQSVFTETINNVENPGIFILEAPMGLGKTEAALLGVEQLAHKTGRSGMFFGLPTQATSNGIFPRIKSWLTSVSKDNSDKFGLRLLHGKAALNPEFDEIKKNSYVHNINIDGEKNGNVTVNEWFSGRKTGSLDDFVVGTVDQFLMVSLKQKHLALRHLGFTKKVVVIDEVHAYDAYMSQYLDQAIRWMGAYGVPVIILSATLPAKRRIELVKHYLFGVGYKKRDWILPEGGLKESVYPLITFSDGNTVKQVYDFEPIQNKNIDVKLYENEDLSTLVAELIKEGGVVGVIVNTVKRAQTIAIEFIELFGVENVELFHSGFIATDRIKKETCLIKMIGRAGKRPDKKIIIGTQVLEQSLDIDFDVLISDLAPMDLLIQRAGRLHRHSIVRPKRHETPVLYVIGVDSSLEFEPGSEAVYGGYLLARTQNFLPDVLSVPEDVSELVQRVYSEEEQTLPDEVRSRYEQMKDEHFKILKIKKDKAQTYRVENPQLSLSYIDGVSLIGWLKNTNPDGSEEQAYAQVRDVHQTIEIIALKEIGDGYGLIGANQDISDQIENEEIAKKIAQHTLRLPGILSTHYRIDQIIQELERFNLRYLKEWQTLSWLKGALGIIFDKDNSFEIGGYRLKYNEHIGLMCEEVDHEKI